MAKTKLSRQQKAFLSQQQMKMWQQLATYEKNSKQYGEPFMYLQTINQMMDLKVIDENTASELADITFVMEYLRIQKKIITKIKDKFEQYAKEQGVDIEMLYTANDLLTDACFDDENFVDTSNLIIGMEVESYPALCQLLGEEATTGKSKQIQMENWKRYFDFEKPKYKNCFIILDIYDEPLPAEERKRYYRSKYINELKVLILKEISKQGIKGQGTIVYLTSFSRLIRKLHIINELFYTDTYDYFLQQYQELFEKNNIRWNYKIFKSNAFRKVKDAVKMAINALVKDDIIVCQKYYVIGEKVDGTEKIIFHQATDFEEADISSAKKKIATQMGYRNSLEATLYAAQDYNRKLSTYYKVEYGWNVVYYQLKFIVKHENLLKHISDYTALDSRQNVEELVVEQVDDYRTHFNDTLTDELKKQADGFQELRKQSFLKRIKSNNNDCADMGLEEIDALYGISERKEITQYGSEFVKIQKLFIETLVKLSPENYREIISYIESLEKENRESSEGVDDLIPELDFIG